MRTQRILRVSRLIMNMAHVSSPVAAWARNASMAVVPLSVNLWMMKSDWAWTPDGAVPSPR
jgi:hypothetical protein